VIGTWTRDELDRICAAVNDAVDAAYRAKYARRSPSIVAPVSRAATLELIPR
jgi:hypothetical protein